MIFRSEEDFDCTLDEFAKARRAWPLYLARSVRLRSPVIGNLAGRRSKGKPHAANYSSKTGTGYSAQSILSTGLLASIFHHQDEKRQAEILSHGSARHANSP